MPDGLDERIERQLAVVVRSSLCARLALGLDAARCEVGYCRREAGVGLMPAAPFAATDAFDFASGDLVRLMPDIISALTGPASIVKVDGR